jgi:RNA polymerase sigma-70 factor (ECF subfamily)
VPTDATSSESRDSRIRALIEAHFALVYRSLRRFGVPASALDDAAQQVFVVAARKNDEIPEGREQQYLLGISIRVASETRRSIARRREEPEGPERIDEAPSPEQLVDRKRAREELDRILAAMPFQVRTVFVLFEIEGLTLPEIAAIEGLPLGTATSRLRRARALFAAAIASRRGEP